MAASRLDRQLDGQPADRPSRQNRENWRRTISWRDFVVYCLILGAVVAALGLGISSRVRTGDDRNAMLEARQQANLVYRIRGGFIASASGSDHSELVAGALRSGIKSAINSGVLAALEIWSPTKTIPVISFSEGHSFDRSPVHTEIQEALRTRSSQETVIFSLHQQGSVPKSAAVVTFLLSNGRVLALFIPYDAIAQRISSQVFRLDLLVSVGLALLYAIVLIIAWSAGRRLRLQQRANIQLATTDALTNLPNRTALIEHLVSAIERSSSDGQEFALALADWDRFKEVNDILGHEVGDHLIATISHRLRAVTSEPNVVARIGGDEFAFLLIDETSEESVRRTTEQLCEVLSTPIEVDGLPIFVEASIGVALFPRDGTDIITLLRHADIAMYAAKDAGTQLAFFEERLEHDLPGRLVLGTEIRRGLEENQFRLYYQPKVEVRSGRPIGAEGLLRWHHPTRGLVMPGEFLPLAERMSLIHDISAYVLREAIAQLAAWGDRQDLQTLSVNVSARSLGSAHRLDEVVFAILDEFGVSPNRLCIEVTETAVVADSSQASVILGRLADAGVRIALDDFGHGYTGIGILRTLPFKELKIDKEYVDRVVDSPADTAILQSMVDLARALAIEVTAEGVETREVLAGITQVGCDLVQGNLISPPLPIEELNQWLAIRSPFQKRSAQS